MSPVVEAAKSDRTPHKAMSVVLDVPVVTGTGGGPDKTILNSPRFLEPVGYRNLCAYMHPPDDPGFETLSARPRPGTLPWSRSRSRSLRLAVVPRLLDLCRREKVAIWHGHDYKSNALGLLLGQLWPMRLVTTVHGWVKHTRRTPLYYGIDRATLKHYEAVISVSADLYEHCLECGVKPSRCLLIENAIDTRQFSRTYNRDEAKQRLECPPNRLLVGAIGRLSEEKGFESLIAAVNRLLERDYDVEL